MDSVQLETVLGFLRPHLICFYSIILQLIFHSQKKASPKAELFVSAVFMLKALMLH